MREAPPATPQRGKKKTAKEVRGAKQKCSCQRTYKRFSTIWLKGAKTVSWYCRHEVLPFVSGFTTPSSPPSLFLEGSGERSSLTKKKRKTKEEELLRIPLRTSNNAPIQLAAQRVDVVFVIFLVVIGNLNTAHSYQIGFNVHTLYEKTPNVLSHTAIQRRPRNGDKKKMNPKPRKKKRKERSFTRSLRQPITHFKKGKKERTAQHPL